MIANIRDIDWQSTPDDLPPAPQHPAPKLLRSSNPDPSARDRYKHMDVRIVQGALKGNFGTIIGTHWAETSKAKGKTSDDEYEELAVVQTETQAIKSQRTYRLRELRERQ